MITGLIAMVVLNICLFFVLKKIRELDANLDYTQRMLLSYIERIIRIENTMQQDRESKG